MSEKILKKSKSRSSSLSIVKKKNTLNKTESPEAVKLSPKVRSEAEARTEEVGVAVGTTPSEQESEREREGHRKLVLGLESRRQGFLKNHVHIYIYIYIK